MTAHAYLALGTDLGALAAGDTYTLAGDEGRHAARVTRVRPGEPVLLTDDSGHQADCTVTSVAGQSVLLAIEQVRDAAVPAVRTVLVQALAKGDRAERAVETTTELGICEIVPWQADRCVARWIPAKAERGRARWASTVHAAVKQSRRPTVPVVADVVDTAGLSALVEEWTRAGALVLVLHEDAASGLGHVLAPAGRVSTRSSAAASAGAALSSGAAPSRDAARSPGDGTAHGDRNDDGDRIDDGDRSDAGDRTDHRDHAEQGDRIGDGGPTDAPGAGPGTLVLIVGPEGGIDPAELTALEAAGAKPVRLGPTVLRSSSAGAAALAALLALTGAWD